MTRRKAPILFLILCLQFQVAAAFVMPCAHQDAAAGGANYSTCHHAAGEESATDGADHFSCVKCVLGCLTGGFQAPISTRGAVSLVLHSPTHNPFLPRHYYRFVPEQPQRPPIV